MAYVCLAVGLTHGDHRRNYDCRLHGFWPGARQDIHTLNLGDVSGLDPVAWADAVYRAGNTEPGTIHHIGPGVPEVRRILVARPDRIRALATGDTVTTCDPAAQTCVTHAFVGGEWQPVPTQRDAGEAHSAASVLWPNVHRIGLDDTRGTWRVLLDGPAGPFHYLRDGVAVCRCCWQGPITPADVVLDVPDDPRGLLT